MVLTDKKQALLEIIQDADEKLLGLMIALANEYNDEDYIYSKEELAFFEKRRESFFESGKKGYTVKEAHEKIRRNYKNGL
ncbi:MAG TPA: hypothetical protein VFI29_10085 [Hanamia sp.]|nr:hypothetical protein [Hanamia sp.]